LLQTAKRAIIVSAIEDADGNYSEAARRLGIHPNNLHRLIRGLGIREEIKKTEN
jgi:DNA-binding NtrC family response regulator